MSFMYESFYDLNKVNFYPITLNSLWMTVLDNIYSHLKAEDRDMLLDRIKSFYECCIFKGKEDKHAELVDMLQCDNTNNNEQNELGESE